MIRADELAETMTQLPLQVEASNQPNRRLALSQALTRAVSNDELFLHYQPQIDLKTKKIVTMEALCRWSDSKLGNISPAEFIDIAEEFGQIVALGRWVIVQVGKDLPSLLHKYPNLRIGLNLSIRELSEPDFFDWFQSWLDRMPANTAQQLEIEITESTFMKIQPEVATSIQQLRSLGIHIAIDDFGTGMSSLARLHMLPFDKIKLDKLFADQINHPLVFEIIQSMAVLSHKFGKKLLLEGIETQEQEQLAIQAGCDCAQGYLFHRPAALSSWI
jgi:EAL domain-containing protein (putative c-di-GMP-specific phosphodiesterase class I)